MALPALPSLPMLFTSQSNTPGTSTPPPAPTPSPPPPPNMQQGAAPISLPGIPGPIPLIPIDQPVTPGYAQLKTIFDSAKIPTNIWSERVKPVLDAQGVLNTQTVNFLNARITQANEARQSAERTQALVDIETDKPLNVNAGLIAMNQIAADFAQRLDPARNYLAAGKSREDLYIAQAKEKRLETLRTLERNAQLAYNYASKMSDQVEMAKAQNQLNNTQAQISVITSSMSDWFKAQDAAAQSEKEYQQELEKINYRVRAEAAQSLAANGVKLTDQQKERLEVLKTTFQTETRSITDALTALETNMTLEGEEKAAQKAELFNKLARIQNRYKSDTEAVISDAGVTAISTFDFTAETAKPIAARLLNVDPAQRASDLDQELMDGESQLWDDIRAVTGDENINTSDPEIRKKVRSEILGQLRTIAPEVDQLKNAIIQAQNRLENMRRSTMIRSDLPTGRNNFSVSKQQELQNRIEKLYNRLEKLGFDRNFNYIPPDDNEVDIDAEAEEVD